MKLTPYEQEVLRVLNNSRPRNPSYMNNQEKAALSRLRKKGVAKGFCNGAGNFVVTITPAGRAALAELDKAKEGQQ